MKVLCVAEKPSIARSISEILCSGNGINKRPGKDKYCLNYTFQYRLPPNHTLGPRVPSSGGWVDMIVTSVKGHLMSSEFREPYNKWHSCQPSDLFSAPIVTNVSADCLKVAQNLKEEARRADLLMIWTDCDREGEHIGAEVVKVCRQVKARLEVKRARFSAIIANQIHRAAQNPIELDWRAAEAVESRIELDLRLGAAFTRMQCYSLQSGNEQLHKRVISYGPCQFPTLGFVVDRYIVARDFVPQPFWYIAVMDKREDMQVNFNWSRNHLFERQAVLDIYQRCRASPHATVKKVASKQTRKFKPSPLTTVELQKSGGRLLRMTPKRVLDIAEKLYQRGILSYPRTETDQYDKEFDFHALINKQTADTSWGAFASRLANTEERAFERPINGAKNDKAHPPIHPTRHAGDLSGEEKKVYEYVVRRFLASCNKHAVGKQTTVDLDIAKEIFSASGVVVVERNYLEVYTYDKWGGPALPEYHEGERFKPTKMEMKEGETTRPKLLTEADLVSLMDRNGIGTDATIAEHISKIIERDYVKVLKEGQISYLIPSELGMGLVEGYNAIEFDGNKSLCKPLLRRETEERMALICEGTKTKDETVQLSLQEYKAVFDKTKQDIGKLIERVNANLRGDYAQGGGEGLARGDGAGEDGNETDRISTAQITGGNSVPSASVAVLPAARATRPRPASPAEVFVVDSEEEEEFEIEGPRARSLANCRGGGLHTTDARQRLAGSSSILNRQGPPVVTPAPPEFTDDNDDHNSNNGTCFQCGQSGHWSRDCPARGGAASSARAGERQQTSFDGSSSKQVCFSCGEGGHWASDCTRRSRSNSPQKRQRVGSSRGANTAAYRRNGATFTNSSRGRRGRG